MPAELRAEMSRVGLARAPGLGRGAPGQRLRGVPAGAAQEPRPPQAATSPASTATSPSPTTSLLDDYERGMTTAEVRALFDYLKEHQAPLVKRGRRRAGATPPRGPRRSRSSCRSSSSSRSSRALRLRRRRLAARPDRAPVRDRRPASHDIRITTRYFEDNLDGLFATMHEFGHGLYEHQIDPALERTPLARRRLARHARVAEPDVGEPRRPLAAVLAPLLPAAPGAVPGGARRATTSSAGTARSTPSSRR